PVWKSDDPTYPRVDVYGSLDELERDFGVRVTDLHRPVIDDLTRPNPDDPSGASTMRRIPDVLDVWFDSGSMPFAQVHYPFENREWFDSHSPADFIVEYISQTRGWFYLMHVLSTALFDRPAFTNVISHGTVLGSDGQKMSKSLRNYPDVNEVFDRDGADAMRWYLLASPILRGGTLTVTDEGIRAGVRELLLPLWSTYYFFTLYANTAGDLGDRVASEGGVSRSGYTARWRTDSPNVLDRYLLAKTRHVVETVGTHFDEFDTPFAAAALRDFGDVLTNWYVRRSRDRFWGGAASSDGRDAFDTLYTVLETITRVAAPLLPLVSDEIWRGLTGGRSVHLTDWPDAAAFPSDPTLVAAMDRVREIASSGLALRKARGLRVRLPLAGLTVVGADAASLVDFADILRDELNVKSVNVAELRESSLGEFGIVRRLSVNARALGPRVGKDVQRIIQAAKAGDWSADGDAITAGGTLLESGEYGLELEAADAESAIAFLPSGGFVVLDTHLTPELEAEGLARDIVRAVQQARKDAGLDVGDRIALSIAGDATAIAAVAAHQTLIAGETLAVVVEAREAEKGAAGTAVGSGSSVTIEVERAHEQSF
ncbi:MAG: class I tRNA ligase family protein, partial [Pseudolysinimonas sp.]